MGSDPRRSVVDRWGIAHDVPNLAIVDGSVFPTSGGVNPTSTIAALSLRAAEHIATHRSQIRRPERGRTFSVPAHAATAFGAANDGDAGEPAQDFDAAERDRLAALADLLIPAGPSRPSPSEVCIGQVLLDQVVAARPDIATALHRALEPSTVDAAARLCELAETDAPARDALELAVAGGYYMSAEVRAVIGYPGEEPVAVTPDPYPQYVEEGLLDHLVGAAS
jgi:hypothetical protein